MRNLTVEGKVTIFKTFWHIENYTPFPNQSLMFLWKLSAN